MWIAVFLAAVSASAVTVVPFGQLQAPISAQGLALLARKSSVASRLERNSSGIPLTLLFNHKRNLLDISEESGLDEETRLLRQNVLHTVNSFRGAGEPRVLFWDNNDCVQGLRGLTEFGGDELAEDFEKEPMGMVKSDLCRLAMLYLHGGYYFDTDIVPVVPMCDHIGKDTTFATIRQKDEEGFFQAFIAATPKHPLMAAALNGFRTWYHDLHQPGQDEAAMRSAANSGNVGTALLKQAFTAWSSQSVSDIVDHNNGHVSRFFIEQEIRELRRQYPDILPGISGGYCNYAVVDNAQPTLLMYSRVYDSRHGFACREEAQLVDMKK